MDECITDWTRPVTDLAGVGLERAALLARLGVNRIGDLLLHAPRRYEDRRQLARIAELQLGDAKTVEGVIMAAGVKRYQRGRKSVFEFVLEDGTGRLHCRWWNLPYLANEFQTGQRWVVHGKVSAVRPRTMDHPEVERVEDDAPHLHLHRIVPIYPLTDGISQRWLRTLIWKTLARSLDAVTEPWPNLNFDELPSRARAIQTLHFPESMQEPERARQRLALEELIELQCRLRQRRKSLESRAAVARCAGDNSLIKPFLRQIRFKLTSSQTKVLREIRQDLNRGVPMRRLLQGDVGSGKTVVAACTALMVLESGLNAVLMAPTELLAEQHFGTFCRWLAGSGVQVELRTGSVHSQAAEARPGSGESRKLVIGTHALAEEQFQIDHLGLVIIDEQHKFGVAQRELLLRKGIFPHLLVMTATPIPRTLGLTIYGDLDVSIIAERPAGRQLVRTFVRTAVDWPKIRQFIRQKLGEGRQVFFVYPRVEGTPAQEVKGVTDEYQRLAREFSEFKTGLLHGRLSRPEREVIMAEFRANAIQVLVSTPVIEVGVDIPNATIMVIENAERFGLAQLHQLRGRVGRSSAEAFCILVPAKATEESRRRLQILAEEADGFRIAEADLGLRGPGDFLGADQSGLPPFRFADLTKDIALVERAREIARRLV